MRLIGLGQAFDMGARTVRHLSGSQWERLCGVLISILASVLFAVAENFMSDEDDEDEEMEEF